MRKPLAKGDPKTETKLCRKDRVVLTKVVRPWSFLGPVREGFKKVAVVPVLVPDESV